MEKLSQYALFLTVVLPAVGALLVLVSARQGISQVRRIALTNVLITFLISLVVVADYKPGKVGELQPSELIQMRTSIPWVGSVDESGTFIGPGPDIQFALGVDGLSEIVRETSKLPLQEMKEQILHRVTAWRHGPPDDDMSLVIIEIP